MQLTVNIHDKSEISTAIALLQLIAGHTFSVGAPATPSQPNVLPMADNPAVGIDPASAFGQPTAPMAPLPTIDPAAAFGAPAALNPAAAFGAPGNVPPALPDPAAIFAATQAQAPTALTASLPPANALPLPGTTPGAAYTPGVELDAEGLPWDDRIHQATKGKTTKNVWKVKKGFNNDALLNSIKAELKARVSGGAPAAAAQPAAAPFVPPAASFQPAQPVAPSAPAAPLADPTTWADFMPRVSQAILSGVITTEAVNAVAAQYQLPSVSALQQYPGHIAYVWAALKTQYPALA